jgi:hypothetical protein
MHAKTLAGCIVVVVCFVYHSLQGFNAWLTED